MRISNMNIKNNLVDNIRRNYEGMHQAQMKLSSSKKYIRPSENPMEAINSIYSRIRIKQIDQYQQNISNTKSHMDISHDVISNATALMQDARELTIQAANGHLNGSDRKVMALEIEQILRGLIELANTRLDDEFMYAGADVYNKPFETSESYVSEIGKALISTVDYRGDHHNKVREVGVDDRVEILSAGNQVFWGRRHTIVGLQDVSGYRADRDQFVNIDGVEVSITEGDGIDSIIGAINRRVPSANAFTRELPNGSIVFGIESNDPHQLALEDVKGGTVFQNIGILKEGGQANFPGQNIHANTLQEGGSVFSSLIRLRDSLIFNRAGEIGSKNLAEVTDSLNSMLSKQANLSATHKRIDNLDGKLSSEKIFVSERLSNNQDLDVAKGMMELQQLQNVHKVSLMTASKYIRPTLMDYL